MFRIIKKNLKFIGLVVIGILSFSLLTACSDKRSTLDTSQEKVEDKALDTKSNKGFKIFNGGESLLNLDFTNYRDNIVPRTKEDLTINGKKYDNGIFYPEKVFGENYLSFKLNGEYKTLKLKVGGEDLKPDNPVSIILRDGETIILDRDISNEKMNSIEIDVEGINNLKVGIKASGLTSGGLRGKVLIAEPVLKK